jgi:hypothetical protein
VSVCRQCGAEGEESPLDPCPGLCPPCFDLGMAEIDEQLMTEVQRLGQPPPITFLTDRLRRLGMTDSMITLVAVEILAEDLGRPV